MDNYILTGPNGSQFNVGSYVLPDPGPDFGAKDLLAAEYTETPLAEGGALAAESVGVRRMTFPMRLASSGAFAGGLPGVEAFLASLARPGAYVDLMPQGTATADAVRFDVLGGRYEESHSIPLQRVARREGELHLEVKPYGYWPTEMILASVASIGIPGRLAITGASVLGDVPALARLVIQPTSPTLYAVQTYRTDALAWSLGAKPSMLSFHSAASLTAETMPATVLGDIYAPASQALQLRPSAIGWEKVARLDITSSLEPAYRGDFRAFAWARALASAGMTYRLSIDAVSAGLGLPLASAQPLATIAPANFYSASVQASPAYHLLDLGNISLPPVASGVQAPLSLRVWMYTPTVFGTVMRVALGGLFLLPEEKPGYLTSGLGIATGSDITTGALVVDAIRDRAFVREQATNLAIDSPLSPAPHYRGPLPQITPSQCALDLLAGARPAIATSTPTVRPLIRESQTFAAVSLTYRPRFRFLKSF
jgi:hypothetical protein